MAATTLHRLLCQQPSAEFDRHNEAHKGFFTVLVQVCKREMEAMAPGVKKSNLLKNCADLNRELHKPPAHPLVNAIVFHIIDKQGPFLVWLHEPFLLAPTNLISGNMKEYHEHAAVFFFRIGVAEMNQRLRDKADLLNEFAAFLATCFSSTPPLLQQGHQPLAFTLITSPRAAATPPIHSSFSTEVMKHYMSNLTMATLALQGLVHLLLLTPSFYVDYVHPSALLLAVTAYRMNTRELSAFQETALSLVRSMGAYLLLQGLLPRVVLAPVLGDLSAPISMYFTEAIPFWLAYMAQPQPFSSTPLAGLHVLPLTLGTLHRHLVTLPRERHKHHRVFDDESDYQVYTGTHVIHALNSSISAIIQQRYLPLQAVMEHFVAPGMDPYLQPAWDLVSRPFSLDQDILRHFRQRHPELINHAQGLVASLRVLRPTLLIGNVTTTSLEPRMELVNEFNLFDATLYQNHMGRAGRQNVYLYDFAGSTMESWNDFYLVASFWVSQLSTTGVVHYHTNNMWKQNFALTNTNDVAPDNSLQSLFLSVFRAFQMGSGWTTINFSPQGSSHHQPKRLMHQILDDVINLFRYDPTAVPPLLIEQYDQQTWRHVYSKELVSFSRFRPSMLLPPWTRGTAHAFVGEMQALYSRHAARHGVIRHRVVQRIDLLLTEISKKASGSMSEAVEDLQFYLRFLGPCGNAPFHSQCPSALKTLEPVLLEEGDYHLTRLDFDAKIFIPAFLELTAKPIETPLFSFFSEQWRSSSSSTNQYTNRNAQAIKLMHVRSLMDHALTIKLPLFFPMVSFRWFEKFGPNYHAHKKTVKTLFALFPNFYWENLAGCLMDTLSNPGDGRLFDLVNAGHYLLRISAAEMAQFFDCYYLWVFQADRQSTAMSAAFWVFADAISFSFPDWEKHSFVMLYQSRLEFNRFA